MLGIEFGGTIIPCSPPNLVPAGPGYTDSNFQACTGVRGAEPYANFVTGDQYLAGLSYSDSRIWRNFGIIWAWWVLFVALTIFNTSKWSMISGNSGFLVIPREKQKKAMHLVSDVENQSEKPRGGANEKDSGEDNVEDQLIRNTSVFTWKNLTYTVQTPSGPRVLLDNVQGWVKPGMLGALMGSSK